MRMGPRWEDQFYNEMACEWDFTKPWLNESWASRHDEHFRRQFDISEGVHGGNEIGEKCKRKKTA